MSEVTVGNGDASKSNAKIVYILYLVALVFGITGIVGVVMAYINKTTAPEWLQSHYQYQIRTFWIGGLFMFVGALLSLILIGWFVLLFWVVWLVVRSIKGMQALDAGKPIDNPKAWLFN
ncbi:DUF4870 family protein [Shewanella fidelis]|uniref:Transmembrane protein n=1 Tax=Shewanella fidelis TaxID=173509 RepID=A0AAW8NT00_9GAMM|nr:hypothetical protein [Shewanella fidelis]MDR8525585.1 hypothetical protein [Shewanella fidelis]MDW4813096.1 hypothetical protein [Shewanella fidelis]MDW4817024.1 hypothetical protein [Shewanella fidelis]MDW4820183.1 hypothetical protein [Shewanella fidelis]MDW4825561.1 hypothetical protein [Shewanella fidelis]